MELSVYLQIIKRRWWLNKQGVLINYGGVKVIYTRCAGGFVCLQITFLRLQALLIPLSKAFTS